MSLPIAPRPAGSAAFDLAAFGENSLDLVCRLTGRLESGAKVDLSGIERLAGGQAATAAVACARLGWSARYIGVLGQDEAGATIDARLRAEHVDVAATWRGGVATRTAIVLVEPDGERTVLPHRPGALSLEEAETPTAAAAEARILLVDSTDTPASIRMARAARAAGVPVILDADRPGEGIDELLALTDAIVVPAAFAEVYTGAGSGGAALQVLARRFRSALIVITLGADGSLALAGDREIRTRAPAVPVRDTTGAGDAFRGGLAAAWLELGPAAEAEELLRYANVVAALGCREVGALTALPRRAELAPYL